MVTMKITSESPKQRRKIIESSASKCQRALDGSVRGFAACLGINRASTPPRGLFVDAWWDKLMDGGGDMGYSPASSGGGDEEKALDEGRAGEGGEVSLGSGLLTPMTAGGGDIDVDPEWDEGVLDTTVVVTLIGRVGACTNRAALAVADGVGTIGFELAV